ncbi:FGFR4 [Branchiostoma lanceolatum]|uniref:FGFR4 protein n=1 Tax=Branchiostoma lanceolatum TaxID=7740 RepID=A0A8K0EEK2_BRALA|nr:FGFR4 [Branchiostoma lanceolatum]
MQDLVRWIRNSSFDDGDLGNPTCSSPPHTLGLSLRNAWHDRSCQHGTCYNNTCLCDRGWTGLYCEDGLPLRYAWRDRSCLHGTCDNSTCLCERGWTGLYCEVVSIDLSTTPSPQQGPSPIAVPIAAIAASSAGIAAVMILAAAGFIFIRRWRKRRDDDGETIYIDDFFPFDREIHWRRMEEPPPVPPRPQFPGSEVDPSRVTLGRRIGSGAFGVVFGAVLTRGGETEDVVVKTVRGKKQRRRERERKRGREADRQTEKETERDREGEREREGQRETETERDRERQRERERETETERETDRERKRERQTEKETDRDRQKGRETERDRERERERQRERKKETDRETESDRERQRERKRETEREKERDRKRQTDRDGKGTRTPSDDQQIRSKLLDYNASEEDKLNFLQEIRAVIDLGANDNLLGLVGCCTLVRDHLYLITEFMMYGDLKNFLIRCQEEETTDSPSDDIYIFQALQMYQVARQIARGMDHIARSRYVHGDLAARNVLVGEDLKVKISDFGLAEDIYSRGYRRQNREKAVPLKWMAPERLQDGSVYTAQSDVWSFGIVLYEISSLGGNPFPDVPPGELKDRLQAGHRMAKPERCPQAMYGVMMQCWSWRPTERPTFRQLELTLDKDLSFYGPDYDRITG